jgi:hypothetical protein
MATLKKLTRMGADVRQIARLLQAKAPEGHMLAYITPDEAKLLKSQGGSGKEHENTGVPSFEMGDYGDYSTTSSEPAPMSQAQIQQQLSYQQPESANVYSNISVINFSSLFDTFILFPNILFNNVLLFSFILIYFSFNNSQNISII